ncbi:MAG: hypothetical protein ABR538_00480, partial [Candidatus Binatia bacterium]
MYQKSTKAFVIAALLAALPAAIVSPAAAAPTPGQKCAQGYVKAVAKCAKVVAGSQAKCFKSTGAKCADPKAVAKISKATIKANTATRAKCDDNAAVADAGYGPYTVLQFGFHATESCQWQARLLSERTFDADGSRYTAADDDGKKCLVTAAKESSKHFSKSLGSIAKCVETGCNFDFSAGTTEVATKLAGKCADFTTVVGTDAATFVAAAAAQIREAVASPCDPLDGTRCGLPFPNDYFSVSGAETPSGHRLAIGPSTLPKNNSKHVAPQRWNDADGFSIGAMLLMNDTDIDLDETGAAPITDLAQSLDSNTPVVLVDAVTGEQQLLWLERDQRGATVDDQLIIGRVGRNLLEGRRYIVAMRNIKDSLGNVLPASAEFALYRDNTPSTILPVEARRAHMEEMLTTLEGHGIARNNLYLAWDFTTQSSESTAGRLLAMRDDAFDILGSAAPTFNVASTTEPLIGDDANMFRRVDGTFQVPLYLTDAGIPGSVLRTDVYGVPRNDGDFFTASFRCVIPRSANTGGAAPAIPARISLYGHGLLGSHTEVTAGNVRAMANEHNMVFCATDWTGFASGDQGYVGFEVLADFSKFPNFIDRQHQGVLNMLYLGRLLKHANGFTSHPAFQVGGESMLDTSDLFYDGNSQGGILGGVVAAFAQDLTRLSLGVPGMNYSTLLHRSVDFDIYEEGFLIPTYPSASDRNMLLSVAQVIWDRTDPNGHINHMLADPYAGTPAKKILYQVAFGDHQVAPVTVEIAARSNGAHIHTPVLDMSKIVPEVTPYYDIPAIPAYPFDGSAVVIWDSGNPAPPIGNVTPESITNMDPEWIDLEACVSSTGDPHSCPRSDPDARVQKSEFLKTTGAVVDVCGGAACSA